MRILHISADYPDPLQPAKTRAVSNLLALADGHEHRVVSLNRVGWRAGIRALDFADAAGATHRAVAYGAPGKGLFLLRYLADLEDWIAADCRKAGFAPDLIHAHKLTVEGIVGEGLARTFSAPLAISVQGNTDLKIVGARRDLRSRYARIWREAAVAFPFAPWAREELDARLGPRQGPIHALPCPGPADTLIPPAPAPAPVIRTAFHFRDAVNKNAAGLIRAVALAAKTAPNIQLEIIGGGDPGAFAALARGAEAEAPGRVSFLGAVDNSAMQDLFNTAAAFALVSHRESYGMVFAESLLAGCPCLIPRGRAIDGYFPNGSVVVTADPGDVEEIAAGLARLVHEEAAFKERLDGMGAAGGLDLLRRDAICATYLGALEKIET